MEDRITIVSGGTVVCEHEVLPHHDVILENDRIVAVRPSEGMREDGIGQNSESDLIRSAQSIIDEAAALTPSLLLSQPTVIDARGCYVMPGMIDVHSDYIETIASPRPSVVMDLAASLYEAERELVAHGITTIYHSLSVYGAKIFDHKPIRNFENVSALIGQVKRMRGGEELDHLIRHRLHLRVELDAVDLFDAISAYLAGGTIDLLSFMDHTPGQGQYADLEIFGNTLKGYRDIDDEEVARIIAAQQASNKLGVSQMKLLSQMAKEHGIAVASHDDDSCKKLDLMERLETSISEFPITLEVAQSARDRGMHTLAGAPNVLMGHSHSGNLSAREAVQAGAIDILCSDYYPSAMLSAVFTLYRNCGIGLADACALVSINPARAVRIDKELGSIAEGKRADLLLVRELSQGTPVVTQAFVGGRPVFQSNYLQFSGAAGDAASAGLPQREEVEVR